MSIESMKPSNHLILCHPLLLPSIFPRIRVFPNESAPLIRWPNCLKNSCVSSHKDEKKQSCLTKKSLSHLVNRPVRSLKKTTCVSCVNLTLYGGIVLVSWNACPGTWAWLQSTSWPKSRTQLASKDAWGNDYGSQGKKWEKLEGKNIFHLKYIMSRTKRDALS